MNVSVLGGGIAGLSSAFYLATRQNIPKISLYEASNKLNGWINSESHNGYYFESSARTLRPKGITGNTTLELIQLLGLEDKIVPITSERVAGKFRLTYRDKQFFEVTREIDNDLKKLFSSVSTDNESIYNFTSKRLGKDLADNIISPMIGGICVGDAKEISAKFLAKGKDSPAFEPVELYNKARNEHWNFYTLQGGLETLPKAVIENLSQGGKVSLNTSSSCSKIHFEDDGSVKLSINENVETASHVISALPSHRLAPLIEHQHPELAHDLAQLKSNDSATVNLHFPSENLLKKKGFGVFVPPAENSPITGIIFDSMLADMKGTTVTVIFGGKSFGNLDDRELLETALQQVKEILGITEAPDNSKVTVMRKSFPQYNIGHYTLIEKIKNYIKANKLPLSLCGQSYDGIGINEVILSAKLAAFEF